MRGLGADAVMQLTQLEREFLILAGERPSKRIIFQGEDCF